MQTELPVITSYEHQFKTLLAVDCIIFGFDQEELKLLLIKRDFEPEKGRWSLLGGFMKVHETLDQSADRVMTNLTGLQNVYLEQLRAFSALDRDPVERTISVAYFALINIESHDHELSRKFGAEWFSLKDVPTLIFDHDQMVQVAISALQHKAKTQPIGFELLPERFTMRQLQKLYEAILDDTIDKRNFTKKINQLDILKKLAEKDMQSSKKGSFLYEFDKEKYNRKVGEGFQMKI